MRFLVVMAVGTLLGVLYDQKVSQEKQLEFARDTWPLAG
jgi:hypothetical protein